MPVYSPVVNLSYQLSVISYQLSVISYQLSVIRCEFSDVSFQFTENTPHLPISPSPPATRTQWSPHLPTSHFPIYNS
ncbi:MAG: hypothetical protein IM509_20490 [Microcystis sp. M31BS1]|uniref:hypothetical protein n=1 Tax=Microcystis sp. M31BS1 TaxID=2771186 RepID=UPI002583DEDD|nr:hypothetical protein [Microcystis sp. M31BS1]MCA2593022.1 hypothetical protein [Microcystis sp. M31BS1]